MLQKLFGEILQHYFLRMAYFAKLLLQYFFIRILRIDTKSAEISAAQIYVALICAFLVWLGSGNKRNISI